MDPSSPRWDSSSSYSFIKGLPSWYLRGLAAAAIGLFVVAVGLDFAEGLDSDVPEHIGDFFSTSADRVIHFSKSIEELFEMAGATSLLFVFMRKLLSLTQSVTVAVSPGSMNGDRLVRRKRRRVHPSQGHN